MRVNPRCILLYTKLHPQEVHLIFNPGTQYVFIKTFEIIKYRKTCERVNTNKSVKRHCNDPQVPGFCLFHFKKNNDSHNFEQPIDINTTFLESVDFSEP